MDMFVCRMLGFLVGVCSKLCSILELCGRRGRIVMCMLWYGVLEQPSCLILYIGEVCTHVIDFEAVSSMITNTRRHLQVAGHHIWLVSWGLKDRDARARKCPKCVRRAADVPRLVPLSPGRATEVTISPQIVMAVL